MLNAWAAFKTKFPDASAWVAGRLQEKSTVVGALAVLANLLGVVVAPERADAIATLTAAISSFYLVIVKERRPPSP